MDTPIPLFRVSENLTVAQLMKKFLAFIEAQI